jgi:RNA polymerase sigma-70 factor (ECF subfamily)
MAGMNETPSVLLQQQLDLLRAGELAVRDQLLALADQRLQRLARKMFGDFPRLGRWVLPEDVSQGASLRLWRSLEELAPATARDFYRLAALHIRRELLDLARRFFGPAGAGAHHASPPPRPAGESSPPAEATAGSTYDPVRLANWTEFHTHVEALPGPEREVVDLHWYQGLSQPEAAALLGVNERTLKRRWQAVRLRLAEALRGEPP